MIVKALGQGEDLAQRSSVKVMKAANKAIRGSSVIIAHQLPSGDIILTFKGKAEEHTKDTA